MQQAKDAAADLRAQVEDAGRKASELERQLVERGAASRELQELQTLTRSQEQRVTQSLREAQQKQAELASLEAILALLHLREVNRFTLTSSSIRSFSWLRVIELKSPFRSGEQHTYYLTLFITFSQGPEGPLCTCPCMLPPADYSETAHLLQLKPGRLTILMHQNIMTPFIVCFKHLEAAVFLPGHKEMCTLNCQLNKVN